MMTEISLNVLDVVNNCVRANATLIEITIEASTIKDRLCITIKDNGCGMSEEQMLKVSDPFFTTRNTRKVGLGIPFFKMAALCTGGSFDISSKLSVGTVVTAEFVLSHIDRMPLGDIVTTIQMLITMNCDIDFIYKYKVDDREFILDTRQMRELLGETIKFSDHEISEYIKEYLTDNTKETDGDVIL